MKILQVRVDGLGAEQMLYINMQQFRGGLVFKAHIYFNHPILGLRVMKKKRRRSQERDLVLLRRTWSGFRVCGLRFGFRGLGLGIWDEGLGIRGLESGVRCLGSAFGVWVWGLWFGV